MGADKVASLQLMAVNNIVAVAVLFCSLVLLLDYLLPGSLEHAPIREYDVFTTKVRGGSATTYNIVTEKYQFPISEEFLASSNVGDTVSLEVSRMLKIINAYGLQNQKETYAYYTRYLTGLFFPLILLLLSLVSLRLQEVCETTLSMLIGLQILALFIFFMTILNISNLF